MIVYMATNRVNGKTYIGQTIQDLSRRKSSHKCDSTTHKGTSYFYNSIRKYGFDNFVWSILCKCESKDELDEMEFHYIKSYHSHISEGGYNISYGGDGGLIGHKMSEETKRKMSLSTMGKSNGMLGMHHTDETKKKMSRAQSGEGNGFYGKHHMQETIDKFREGQVGYKSKFSKSYEITYPDGNKVVVKGIRQFCRDNNLTHQLMCAVSKGKQTHHKGYKCKEI